MSVPGIGKAKLEGRQTGRGEHHVLADDGGGTLAQRNPRRRGRGNPRSDG
jgi:hypothetical protein